MTINRQEGNDEALLDVRNNKQMEAKDKLSALKLATG